MLVAAARGLAWVQLLCNIMLATSGVFQTAITQFQSGSSVYTNVQCKYHHHHYHFAGHFVLLYACLQVHVCGLQYPVS